jgi:diguanylate cyclase (GGDEF)-like protein
MPMRHTMDGVVNIGLPAVGALDALAGVAREGADAAVERSLAAARELLGMRLAYIAELSEDELRFVALDGDATPFGGPGPGSVMPRTDTLCDRMLRGEIPNVIPDTAATPDVDEVARPLGVGAYVGVPVRLVDGTVYGSLCCVSDHPAPGLRERDARLLDVLARIIADQIDRERHQRREARLEGEATAGQALLAALKARERYTAEHSAAVVELSTAVARELGLSEEETVQVAQVALLHDVGKLGVPEAILQKPGALTDAEWRIVRAHPAIGERVVASIATLAHLAPAVRAEHERWDGGGYPDGLAGAAIPLASRICLACDAWHAMTSDRPYRPALREADARAELRRHAGAQFCPRTVEALLTVLAGKRSGPAPEKAPDAAAQPESELRALIAVASAVAAAHRLEDVLEVVAEETRRVVGASSVSISRWEREQDRVRTLINVGELGPDEERFPTGETYALADYPLAARLLREGESYVISRGDPDLGVHDRQLLDALDKGSYIGVPVIFDGRTWGKLESFANVGAVPFTRRHVPFMEAIAGQVGAAIGRAELFSRVNALAYSDPLTGLGNRRSLDERLEAAVERGGELAIAFCDLDGLKQINDTRGHDAGDRAIRCAADALAAAAHGHPGASVYRVGGDEFCVVLEGGDAGAAAALAGAGSGALAELDEPLSLSCGAAALRPGARPADLFRAADTAQYAAKRQGPGRVVIAGDDAPAPPPMPGGRRARRDRTDAEARALAHELLAAIDGAPETERADRLTAALRAT